MLLLLFLLLFLFVLLLLLWSLFFLLLLMLMLTLVLLLLSTFFVLIMFVAVVAAKFLVLVLVKLTLMVGDVKQTEFIRSIPVTPTAHASIEDTTVQQPSQRCAHFLCELQVFLQVVQPCSHGAEELRNWCLQVHPKPSHCLRIARTPT